MSTLSSKATPLIKGHPSYQRSTLSSKANPLIKATPCIKGQPSHQRPPLIRSNYKCIEHRSLKLYSLGYGIVKYLRIDHNFCSVHEKITSIRLYTLCNLRSGLRKGVYNLIEVISNELNK